MTDPLPHNDSLPIGPDFPWLAPLAGFTDLPFRLLCREQGAAVACTEMISAKGLVFGQRQGGGGTQASRELLSTCPADLPLVVQLFGAEAEYLEEAVLLLRDWGYQWFDLNMGCPVPKVNKTGAGSAMLKDIPNALDVAGKMIRAAGTGRVGFKMRLGWDRSGEVYLELGRSLAEMGAGWLSLHSRYARQGFGGTAQLEPLGLLAGAVSIPVIASGDLLVARDGLDRLKLGVSGVMFARGALANPFIFSEYTALRRGGPDPGPPTAAALHRLILRHMELARELTPGKPGRKGCSPALLKMRTVVPRYVRHLPGVKKLRLALVRCQSWQELTGIVADYFQDLDRLPQRQDPARSGPVQAVAVEGAGAGCPRADQPENRSLSAKGELE